MDSFVVVAALVPVVVATLPWIALKLAIRATIDGRSNPAADPPGTSVSRSEDFPRAA